MSESTANWTEIEAAYRRGMTLGDICKKYRVGLGKLVRRLNQEGWNRDGAGGSPPGGRNKSDSNGGGEAVKRLPVPLSEATERAVDEAVQEALADIVGAHKSITRKLRERFEAELAEFDESTKYMATFRDEAHIAQLAEHAKKDSGKALREYLTQCLAHHTQRAAALEKLTRIGDQAVDLERAVWGLEKGASGSAELGYDDLLDEIKNKRPAPHSLPDNIVRFEERLKKARDAD